MDQKYSIHCTAFAGDQRIASGELTQVALQTKLMIDQGTSLPVLIFNDTTSEQIEIDFRGTVDDVRHRSALMARTNVPDPDSLQPSPKTHTGPGRPKLGVVAREVTLLPRHWEWLNGQPGGASVALRKLVEQARRSNEKGDRIRKAQESTYRFMSVMAGNLPVFEEATRALFAKHQERFNELIAIWPTDIRDHTNRLAATVFEEVAG